MKRMQLELSTLLLKIVHILLNNSCMYLKYYTLLQRIDRKKVLNCSAVNYNESELSVLMKRKPEIHNLVYNQKQ